MQDFRELRVWKKSHHLVLVVYRVTGSFPRQEMFGLTSQMRRSAASIAANLAEGCGRSGSADVRRFVQIAMGSASELEYHLLLAHDLNLISKQVFEELWGEATVVKRMLSGLIQRLGPTQRGRVADNG